jgi:transcriptional regulator with XRE-family HTH domain
MTQADLSRSLGVSFQQVQKYEKAGNRISASTLVTIAAELGVTVAELLGEADAPSERIGGAVLATPGAAELLDRYSKIEQPHLRRMVLVLATGLASGADRQAASSSDEDNS